MSWYDSSGWGDEGQEQNQDPWSSIVDLMSAFALVLFLAVTFFIINYNRANELLKQRQIQLVSKEKLLKKSFIALQNERKKLIISQKSEKKLSQKNKEIEQQLLILGEKEKKLLAAQEKLIAERKALMEEKKKLSELVQKNTQLLDQQKKETELKAQLVAQLKKKQQRCEEKLKALLRMKRNVLTAIYQKFQTTGVKGIGFDRKTGKFRLGGNVLFAKGKSYLTPEGKKRLKQVMYVLDKIIWKPEVRKHISGIMIEGHADQTGTVDFNWKLSSRRALSAVRYLLSLLKKAPKRQAFYSKLFFAAAFGQYHPIKRNGKIDRRRSRRIEIKVLFKNLEGIQNIVKQSNP